MFTDQAMHLVVDEVGVIARHGEVVDQTTILVVRGSTYLSGDFNRLLE